jgi:hypothetical protein
MEHQRCETIIKIENMIMGNGVQGMAGLVADHEEFIQRLKGIGIFLSVSNVAILLKLFVFK